MKRTEPAPGGSAEPARERARGPTASRRAVLGLGALGAGAAAALTARAWWPWRPAAANAPAAGGVRVRASEHRPAARPVPENARPGDPDWEIRHLGPADALEAYAGAASVLPGESFPLFVSCPSGGFRITAFRLGWYQGTGAREVWRSGPLRAARQRAARPAGPTSTVRADWDRVTEVPTHDWPAGSYLLRLDADAGPQRYVPVTVRPASTAGRVVIKNCVRPGRPTTPGAATTCTAARGRTTRPGRWR